MKKKEKTEKKEQTKEVFVRISTLIYGVIIILAVLLGVLIVLSYTTSGTVNTAIGSSVSKFIPLPAAVVNYTNFIPMREVDENLQSLKYFYENQDYSSVGMRVDFSTEDGAKRLQMKKKQLLNKMIEDEAIRLLAKKHSIKVSSKDVDANVESKLAEYGTKDDVVKDLKKRYGWTLQDFKEKVVMPETYRKLLAEKVSSEIESQNGNAQEKIKSAQKKLSEGKDFKEVAKEFSEGSSAVEGGEIGWVKKAQLIPQLGEKIFSLNYDEKQIVESDLGYHIVDVEDMKKEDGEDVLKIRQIFVKKCSFADWLAEQMKLMSIKIPLKGLYWDSSSSGVEFSDEGMKNFEKQTRENYQGDASIYF